MQVRGRDLRVRRLAARLQRGHRAPEPGSPALRRAESGNPGAECGGLVRQPKNKRVHPGRDAEAGSERRADELRAGQAHQAVAGAVPEGGHSDKFDEAAAAHREGDIQ